MVGRSGYLQPAVLHGVDPAVEPGVSTIAEHLLEGELEDLAPGSRRAIIGGRLRGSWARRLVTKSRRWCRAGYISGAGRPALQTFTVAGLFEVGLQDHDATLAIVSLDDAAELAGKGVAPAGLRLRFDDVMAAPVRAAGVAAALGDGFTVRDWSKEHAAYFRAIRIEKTMMSLILMLVVAVAAFNIVAALVMVVNESARTSRSCARSGSRRAASWASFSRRAS